MPRFARSPINQGYVLDESALYSLNPAPEASLEVICCKSVAFCNLFLVAPCLLILVMFLPCHYLWAKNLIHDFYDVSSWWSIVDQQRHALASLAAR